MSFLAKSPSLPQTSPTDAQQASGYKEAEPVPLGWGQDMFGSHWLCAPYNWRTQTAGSNKPEWQYCSIIAGYMIGPIDFVGRVLQDGKEICRFDYAFAPGEDSHEFVINPSLALGQAWKVVVHRGTETDTPSAALLAATGQNHPPYRGTAWAEWINIDLGAGNTSLPSLTLELRRNAPAVGAYAGGCSAQYGVNPFAAVYALLTEAKGGIDADASLVDAAHYGTQALALEAAGVGNRTGDFVKCHAVLSQVKDASAALSEILANIGGYLYQDGGQLKVGWFPNVAPDVSALPQITEDDLEAKPGGAGFPDWNQGASSVVVVFRDQARLYTDAPALNQVPATRETGIVSVPKRIDRPGIHDASQAAAIAGEEGAGPSGDASLNLTVKKSRAEVAGVPLMPADLIAWNYAPHGLELACRIVARRMRSGAASDILQVVRERGAFPAPFVQPVDPRVLPVPVDPGVIDPARVRLWCLPSGFGVARQVAALIDRPIFELAGALLSLSATGAAPWSQILDQRYFAAKCLVTNGGIAAGAVTVRVSTASIDFARFAATAPDALAQADDTLLLLFGDEVASVGAAVAVSAGVFDLPILRGRRGTTAAAQADGTVAWLFLRSELVAAQNAEFYRVRDLTNTYDAGIATKHFKLALIADSIGLAKPDDPGLALQLPDLSPDESAGYTVVISNEAHSVACDNGGTALGGQLGAGSPAKTVVQVLRGSTPLTAVAAGPNSDQFSIALGPLVSTTATKEANDTVRCDTLAADTGTIAIDVLVAGSFTVRKIFSLSKARTGAAGAAGAPGATGATGATGDTGPGIVYRGDYDASKIYFDTPTRRDVVKYSGAYYLTANLAKSGTATWGLPSGSDWASFGATFSSVATDLLLASDATILKTLVMGDGITANAGVIRSNGASSFSSGVGFWLGNDISTPKFRIGDPSGNVLKWDGTKLVVQNGSGFSQFVLDDTHLVYGNMTITPWGGGGGYGTQTQFTSGTHSAAMGAYNFGGPVGFLSVGDTLTGKQVQLLSTGLCRGNTLEATDSLVADSVSSFAGVATFNNRIDISGTNRLNFAGAGGAAYLDESWGVRVKGDSTHHFQVNGGALLLGPQSAFSATPGRVYDVNGVQILREQYVGGLATLADVIACLQYHGLSN